MKRFSLRLEDELHEKLRVESFKTGVSMNEIIVEAVEQKYKIKKERLTMKTIFEYHEEENMLEIYTKENGKTTVQDTVELTEDHDLYDTENIIEDYMLKFGLEDSDIEKINIAEMLSHQWRRRNQ